MHVRVATDVADRDWLDLRQEFIPEVDRQGHAEFLQVFSANLPVLRGFIAIDGQQGAIGFAEASIRDEPVNGCRPGRVVFLEGIYVQPHWRHRGCATSLCREVERWGASEGCTEFASDVFEQDADSIAAHRALGFEETERCVYFRKSLRSVAPTKGPGPP